WVHGAVRTEAGAARGSGRTSATEGRDLRLLRLELGQRLRELAHPRLLLLDDFGRCPGAEVLVRELGARLVELAPMPRDFLLEARELRLLVDQRAERYQHFQAADQLERGLGQGAVRLEPGDRLHPRQLPDVVLVS